MILKFVILPLSTGIGIFLFGLQIMRIGFENLFIDKIKKMLALLTKNTGMGLLTGLIVTAILQSSSAVSLITIGLAHSRVINLRQALGIILGANIGSTITTQFLAFSIQDWGIYLFVIGIICFLMPFNSLKGAGLIFGGLGLLLIGMKIIQSILPALKQVGWIDPILLGGSQGMLSGLLVGILLTAIIQSSTVTTSLTMSLMADQLFSLPLALAIVLGGNLGTCFTAVLGAIGTNRTAKQVATAHVLLNALGVLVFIPLIPYLALSVEWLTSSPMQQVAHAQTLFNVICSLVALPVITYFEKLVILLSPK